MRASVASARVVDHGQTIDSPGTVTPPSAPRPSAGTSRYTVSVPIRSQSWTPLAAAVDTMPSSSTCSSSVQATSSAPVRSVGIPVASAYVARSSEPRRTSRASRVPGSASNPVWRIAVFALLVPSPTSSRASSQTTRSAVAASDRAIAAPTTPAPTTTTSASALP